MVKATVSLCSLGHIKVTEVVKVLQFKVSLFSIACGQGGVGAFDVVVNRRESWMW